MEVPLRQPREIAHVLHDWNAGGKQSRVYGAGPILGIIDVEGVDTCEHRALVHEVLRGICGEKRVTR
jgi:hypothetical protein